MILYNLENIQCFVKYLLRRFIKFYFIYIKMYLNLRNIEITI